MALVLAQQIEELATVLQILSQQINTIGKHQIELWTLVGWCGIFPHQHGQ